jgi:hypothetical protein
MELMPSRESLVTSSLKKTGIPASTGGAASGLRLELNALLHHEKFT